MGNLSIIFFWGQVVLGAFFHDIGHLVGDRAGAAKMQTDGVHLGAHHHGSLGAEFLHTRGFGTDVTHIVSHHVDAKRYLCCTEPGYLDSPPLFFTIPALFPSNSLSSD